MGKEGGQWWQAGALDTFGPEHRRLSPEEDKRVYVGGGGGAATPAADWTKECSAEEAHPSAPLRPTQTREHHPVPRVRARQRVVNEQETNM